VNRDFYLNKLISRRNNDLIKVITGIKRCGKSYLLFNLFKPWLLLNGVKENNIISVKLDEDYYIPLLDPINLSNYINNLIDPSTNNYVLIDEIQTLEGYEALLNSLNNKPYIDVYVTGSNSKLLSSEISTQLRGRDDQIRVYPLTFKEIYKPWMDVRSSFEQFMFYGGMPYLQELTSDEDKQAYLIKLFESVYYRDIVDRYKVDKPEILDGIINTISSSIGSYTSIRNLENTLKTNGVNISKDTVGKYVGYFVNSFLFEKALRYDIKGKQYLEGLYKYYCEDHGLRNARLNFRQQEYNHIMENIIYIELLSRGYLVDVGVVYNSERKAYEVDLIARKGPKQYYLQIAYSIFSEEEINQELYPFTRIKDNFRKIVITFENSPFTTFDGGYERIGIIDFLLKEDYLK
jgi:predicted AAA+ superfamily ATPase